jgi:general secretion pathway protein G
MIEPGAPELSRIHRMILSRVWGGNQSSLGLTLIELLIVVMILATLATLGIPLYANALNNARITKAIADIRVLEREILLFQLSNATFPDTLNAIGRGNLRDPYGNLYQYMRVQGAKIGQLRKDKNLVPVNSDFDLYSMGKDGLSVPPLTAQQSWDDIVRAASGGFVGLASEF